MATTTGGLVSIVGSFLAAQRLVGETGVTVTPGGVPPPLSTETITGAPVTGAPTSITGWYAVSQFGVPTVKALFTVTVGGVGSAQAFGIPTILVGPVKVSPGGVPTAQAFGVPTIKTAVTVTLAGLGSAQAFGLLTLNQGVPIGGVGSAQAFGAIIIRTGFTKPVGGVGSAQAFGTIKANVTVAVDGVDSAQVFGSSRFNVTCPVPGVSSAQAFGSTEFGLVVYNVFLHALECVERDLAELECILNPDPAILNTFLCGEDLVGGRESFLDEVACLDNENVPYCDEPTICGEWTCGGTLLYVHDFDCLTDSGVMAILNTFRVGDGTLVGERATTYLDPAPAPLVLDLQPAGCL